MTHWGYAKCNGPATWVSVAPAAAGNRQSPINIQPAEAKFDQNLKDRPIAVKYDASQASELFNNGHSVQVNYGADGSSLEGGPVNTKFQVAQFHYHWGNVDNQGSEHTVDGKSYAAECHIVHYNSSKYANIGEAVDQADGLCVLGMLIQVGDHEHTGMKKLTDKLDQVRHSGDKAALDGGFDPSCLLPADTSKYWTYPGSLTTPPCFESVTWVVFKEVIEISHGQMEAFRKLRTVAADEPDPEDELAGAMVENYRPTHPLGERTLRASFS